MKNKGFTLVELLAVIVILGIIALIATPIILNIIRNARAEANQRSIDMYASAVKNAIATYELKEGDSPTSIEQVEKYITYDGNPVICGTQKLYSDSKIYLANCTVDGKSVDYEYGEVKIEKGKFTSVCKPADGSETYSTTEGTKYNCKVDPNKPEYTFFVLNSDTESVNLIMDRNICEDGTTTEEGKTCLYAYNLLGYASEGGPVTAMTYLNNATSSWENIETLNITYDDEGKNFRGFVLNGKARLPYYSEVDSSNGSNEYLYENLDNTEWLSIEGKQPTNNISGIFGYWTLSSSDNYSGDGLVVYHCGIITSKYVDDGSWGGVRPVINLSI